MGSRNSPTKKKLERARLHQGSEREAIAKAANLRARAGHSMHSLKSLGHGDAQVSDLLFRSNFDALVDILAEKKILDRTTYNIRRYENILERAEAIIHTEDPAPTITEAVET